MYRRRFDPLGQRLPRLLPLAGSPGRGIRSAKPGGLLRLGVEPARLEVRAWRWPVRRSPCGRTSWSSRRSARAFASSRRRRGRGLGQASSPCAASSRRPLPLGVGLGQGLGLALEFLDPLVGRAQPGVGAPQFAELGGGVGRRGGFLQRLAPGLGLDVGDLLRRPGQRAERRVVLQVLRQTVQIVDDPAGRLDAVGEGLVALLIPCRRVPPRRVGRVAELRRLLAIEQVFPS